MKEGVPTSRTVTRWNLKGSPRSASSFFLSVRLHLTYRQVVETVYPIEQREKTEHEPPIAVSL